MPQRPKDRIEPNCLVKLVDDPFVHEAYEGILSKDDAYRVLYVGTDPWSKKPDDEFVWLLPANESSEADVSRFSLEKWQKDADDEDDHIETVAVDLVKRVLD